ncbi:hypothetical protein RYA97_26350, partial [Pseudomonas syringae group sp. 26L6]|nr:hypothetical protein [Pseudomonas syringae group sp. 26L6]
MVVIGGILKEYLKEFEKELEDLIYVDDDFEFDNFINYCFFFFVGFLDLLLDCIIVNIIIWKMRGVKRFL